MANISRNVWHARQKHNLKQNKRDTPDPAPLFKVVAMMSSSFSGFLKVFSPKINFERGRGVVSEYLVSVPFYFARRLSVKADMTSQGVDRDRFMLNTRLEDVKYITTFMFRLTFYSIKAIKHYLCITILS